MINSEVITRRATVEEVLRYDDCPIKSFQCKAYDKDLNLIKEYEIVVDITKDNFRRVAKMECDNNPNLCIIVDGPYNRYVLNGNVFTRSMLSYLDLGCDRPVMYSDNTDPKSLSRFSLTPPSNYSRECPVTFAR